jgi:diaminohydroxyphosphoribosylaminopyrimidine deaminase/5-amino-6-(5-phosphoribosylamino)uracil reductase
MPVPPIDEQFMARALELARQGIGLASPNPYVGAVVVRDGKIEGEGTHTYAGLKHAEVLALEAAADQARGATLYLNLEPCCHTGRTGPCVDAVIAAGITRVVAAISDPNPLVAGKGFARLRAAGIETVTGIAADAARRLNEAFAKWIRTRKPLVTLKSAMTLDGRIAALPPGTAPEGAAAPRQRSWITGEMARAHVHQLRHQADAILVGRGTVVADDPLLTDRSRRPRRRPLLRVVLDSMLRLPLESKLVASAQSDVVVFYTAENAERRRELEQRGVRVEKVGVSNTFGRPDWSEVLARLGAMEITSVLIEGGSRINGAALAAGVVDKVFLYYAPKILGNSGVPFAAGAGFASLNEAGQVHSLSLQQIGEDFAVEGYLRDPYGDL